MTTPTLLALLAALAVHLYVAAQVWLDQASSRTTKLWKSLLVFALPFVGAILVLLTAASKRMNPRV
jgi:hypothetical protein